MDPVLEAIKASKHQNLVEVVRPKDADVSHINFKYGIILNVS